MEGFMPLPILDKSVHTSGYDLGLNISRHTHSRNGANGYDLGMNANHHTHSRNGANGYDFLGMIASHHRNDR